MTLESSGASSELDIIASLGVSDPPDTTPEPEAPEPQAEPVAPIEQPTEPEPEAPPVSEAPKAEPQDDVKAELERLQRVIAQDPNLRANYMAQKFGHLQPAPIQQAPVYQPPPQPYQQPVQQQAQAPQLPFDPAEYDPMDPTHQVALVTHIMQQQLQPFAEFVNHSKQQETHYQQQQAQQRLQQIEMDIQNKLNESIPGFSDSFKPTASFEQQMLRDAAINAFTREMEQYPQEYWGNPAVHQEVIRKLAPQLNTAAQRLGVLTAKQASSTDPVKQAMAREMTVLGGNAVVTTTANPFSKAAESGDLLGMMAAVSKVK